MEPVTGSANGVPFVALPPEPLEPHEGSGAPGEKATTAPLVVAWHLQDPPRTETAMAAALPLRGIPAWRVYLGLPLSGSRLPAGGLDAFFALSYDDAVLNVFGPVCRQAVDELPGALAGLRDRLPISDAPLGLVGGSVGAFIAQSVLAETDLPVSTVALVSPAIRLESMVAMNEARFDVVYGWTGESRAVADRLDFLARADELAQRGAAIQLVVGEDDDPENIRGPAEDLWSVLSAHAPERTALVAIPGMRHALAEEPGIDPAPPTPAATRVDAAITAWFHRHLATGPTGRRTPRSRPQSLRYV
jgi:pimeloyl-ACP methyl ester carboxylesterase